MYSNQTKTSDNKNGFSPPATSAAGIGLQCKLSVGSVNDPLEAEADVMADRVMRMPELSLIQRKCNNCEEEKLQRKPLAASITSFIQTKGGVGGAASEAVVNQISATKGSGNSMDSNTQTFMQSRFDTDFTDVKIHTGGESIQMNRELNAEAFTVGNDIYFNEGQYNPNSSEGKYLLAHELTHTVQQKNVNTIQRKVDIDDVTDEMIGKNFELTEDEGTLKAGDMVVIKLWNGVGDAATVDHIVNGKKTTVSVPKYKLKPSLPSAKGISHYSAGVSSQQTAVKNAMQNVADQQKTVDDWKAKESSYKKKHDMWKASLDKLEAELKRREGLTKDKQVVMSHTLVKEEMYNRFDTLIKKWVDFYNKSMTPATDLDPNIVKSIIYQETKMGTNGFHLQLGPYSWTDIDHHPIKSRFNLGQTIDSWPQQQYLMIKEMSPTIYAKYNLVDLEIKAKWKGLTQTEAMSTWNGGALYKAVQKFFAAKDGASKNLLGNSSDLSEDYEFWIRTCVQWLFFKYQSLSKSSWSEAVQAFNGSGPNAKKYKTAVMSRVGTAKDISVP